MRLETKCVWTSWAPGICVLLLWSSSGCSGDDDSTPRPLRTMLAPCTDAGALPADLPTTYLGIPLSCVGGLRQLGGLGPCETDGDCARWSGTEHVPPDADPPYSRCIVFAATGERFCERFDGTSVDGPTHCLNCAPGCACFPRDDMCIPDDLYLDPLTHTCVREETRDGGDGRPRAHITACVPGRPSSYDCAIRF